MTDDKTYPTPIGDPDDPLPWLRRAIHLAATPGSEDGDEERILRDAHTQIEQLREGETKACTRCGDDYPLAEVIVHGDRDDPDEVICPDCAEPEDRIVTDGGVTLADMAAPLREAAEAAENDDPEGINDALAELRDELGMTDSEEVAKCGRDVARLRD